MKRLRFRAHNDPVAAARRTIEAIEREEGCTIGADANILAVRAVLTKDADAPLIVDCPHCQDVIAVACTLLASVWGVGGNTEVLRWIELGSILARRAVEAADIPRPQTAYEVVEGHQAIARKMRELALE